MRDAGKERTFHPKLAGDRNYRNSLTNYQGFDFLGQGNFLESSAAWAVIGFFLYLPGSLDRLRPCPCSPSYVTSIFSIELQCLNPISSTRN